VHRRKVPRKEKEVWNEGKQKLDGHCTSQVGRKRRKRKIPGRFDKKGRTGVFLKVGEGEEIN